MRDRAQRGSLLLEEEMRLSLDPWGRIAPFVIVAFLWTNSANAQNHGPAKSVQPAAAVKRQSSFRALRKAFGALGRGAQRIKNARSLQGIRKSVERVGGPIVRLGVAATGVSLAIGGILNGMQGGDGATSGAMLAGGVNLVTLAPMSTQGLTKKLLSAAISTAGGALMGAGGDSNGPNSTKALMLGAGFTAAAGGWFRNTLPIIAR